MRESGAASGASLVDTVILGGVGRAIRLESHWRAPSGTVELPAVL